MMLICNRFAFVPHLCLECKRYIWLEGYRRAEVWKTFIDRPIKENICKSCLTKFDLFSDIISTIDSKDKKLQGNPFVKYRYKK